jgi:hypothetical protein
MNQQMDNDTIQTQRSLEICHTATRCSTLRSSENLFNIRASLYVDDAAASLCEDQ